MDKFNKLIHEGGIYDPRVIKEMGERNRNWQRLGWRERELLLLHIHLCILMCNKELMSKKRKRSLEDKQDLNKPGPSKRVKPEQLLDSSDSTGETISTDNTSGSEITGSSESTWSREEDLLIELTVMESDKNYRFNMLNYMPLVETTMNHISSEWKINVPTKVWDIMDKKNKKFVMIRYTGDARRSLDRYYKAKAEIPENSGLYLIEWGKTKGEWIDMENMEAKGEEKVIKFLIKRKVVLEAMGINTEFFKIEQGKIQDLFPSPWIDSCVGEWTEDILRDQFEKWNISDLYTKEPAPRTITARALLEYLDDVKESPKRNAKLFYKGKILPEHFVQNMHIEEKEDSACVDRVIKVLSDMLEEVEEMRKENMSEKSTLNENILPSLIKTWNCSSKSTFSFINNINCPNHKEIESALGINEKKKIYREYKDDMKQPKGKEIEKCVYPEWYEEVICGMSEKHDMYMTHTPMGDLIRTPPTDSHPLAVVVENAVSDMAEVILQSKAALMTSKMINFYSRLGGAYGQKIIEKNKDKRNIAIFPLISQMTSNEKGDLCGEERLRLCSGIVVRAPSHARKPTDRIGLITIEILKRNEIIESFCTYLKGTLVYICKNSLIVVRQNSIMKEDSSYNTFVSNSMFIPINMLGGMTLENPMISQSEDMMSYVNDIMNRGQDWFVDRYIEGLCFALLGNSRDEGYFAHLRKIFMVVFTWRIGKSSASFDIAKFCEKTNECIVDNPVSMHFHTTLLDILKIYREKQENA